jgi:hypothetical protein
MCQYQKINFKKLKNIIKQFLPHSKHIIITGMC